MARLVRTLISILSVAVLSVGTATWVAAAAPPKVQPAATTGGDASISGIVNDSLSSGISGISVFACPTSTMIYGWCPYEATSVDGGSYTVSVPESAGYTMMFWDTDAGIYAAGSYDTESSGNFTANPNAGTVVTVGTGATTGIDITLPAAVHIEGQVKNAAAAGVAATDVYACAVQFEWEGFCYYAGAIDSGDYSIGVAPNLNYFLEFDDTSGLYASGFYSDTVDGHLTAGWDTASTVNAGTSGLSGVDVTLPNLVHINGKVSDGGGDGLSGIVINAATAGGCPCYEATTAGNGTFSVGVPANTAISLQYLDNSGTWTGGFYKAGSSPNFTASWNARDYVHVEDGDTSGIDTILPGAATTLVVSSATSWTAGDTHLVTVTAEDAYGQVAAGYTGTVHVTSSDPAAVLPADRTFVSDYFADVDWGIANVAVALKTAGSRTITATDIATGTIAGTMNGIMVTPAQASTLLVSTSTAWIAGAAHSVTVTARDAYGNTATGYRGTIHFTGTDTHATLPADYTFVQSDSGSHRFNLGATLSTAGTQSIRARDTAASSITGLQTGIVVGPATLTTFAVSGFPKSDVAGASHGFTVRAVDAYGNTVSSYRGTVHLTGTDVKTVLPPDYTFTATDAGSHTFSVTLKTAGTQSIRARDTVTATITALQTGIVVIPAAASVLTVSGVPTTDAAGTSHSMTVKVLDAYGNTATAYRGSVHFTSTDPKAVLPADYAFTATDAGSHTFSVALKTAGSQSIRARDKVATAVTGLESGITVTPGAASTLSVYGFPSADVAGAAHSITVKALDAYGNTATGYRGTVHLTSTDATANLPANYAFTATDAGIHTFSVTLKTAGTQSIQARDTVTASITGTETAITVGPGVTFTALPNPALRGTTASLTVRTSPGATCSIIVTWPSGTVSSAAGLKTTPTAGSSGLVSWTWNVASNTITGTASAAVTCTFNGVSSQGSANFTVS